MSSKVKNILILIAIAVVIVLLFLYFSGGSEEGTADPLSSSVSPGQTEAAETAFGKDFLNLLLSVRSIKLDDSIFSKDSFKSLRDQSVVLTPDENEGRPNPFAPIGFDLTELTQPDTEESQTPPEEIESSEESAPEETQPDISPLVPEVTESSAATTGVENQNPDEGLSGLDDIDSLLEGL